MSLALIDNIARYLGIGKANVINLSHPEMVVLDPQFTEVKDLLLPATRRAIATYTLQRLMKSVKIELSTLGEEIGARGICVYLIEREMSIS